MYQGRDTKTGTHTAFLYSSYKPDLDPIAKLLDYSGIWVNKQLQQLPKPSINHSTPSIATSIVH